MSNDHLPWLDGLRGIAALWVLLSHVQILTGLNRIPLLSWGDLAVDLFMMLSGFLMAHHYFLRQSIEPWGFLKTFYTFWIRRFFRIAPLYYVLLAAAFILGHWLGEYRNSIALIWPATATPLVRYEDQSLINAITHFSFTFGFIPDYSFRTALPDWSIGLEMQFYLLFPLIMLAIYQLGAVRSSLFIIILCVVARWLFKDFYHQFQMPSFLLIKLYVFLIGIWIAIARNQSTMSKGLVISLMIALCWIYFERSEVSVARFFLVIIMFYLMNNGTLPANEFSRVVFDKIRSVFSCRVSRFLGDTSYSTYLVHLLIVLPIAGGLTRFQEYLMLPALVRFTLCLILSLPIIYLFSWILFNLIEKNGIKLGKLCLQKIIK